MTRLNRAIEALHLKTALLYAAVTTYFAGFFAAACAIVSSVVKSPAASLVALGAASPEGASLLCFPLRRKKPTPRAASARPPTSTGEMPASWGGAVNKTGEPLTPVDTTSG